MKTEQIERLAKEYAENKNKLFSNRITPTETWKEADIREFKQCVDFLLRDHLIVEKSKVIRFYNKLNNDFGHVDSYNDWVVSEAIEYMDCIFGKETFNPTEK